MLDQFLNSLPAHTDILGMHLVTFNLFTLYRLESTGTHVKSQFLPFYPMGVKIRQHLRREMQPGCWSGNTTLDLRIDCLISGLVTLLCFSIQIWRYRQFSHRIDNLCEAHATIPTEVNTMGGSMHGSSGG